MYLDFSRSAFSDIPDNPDEKKCFAMKYSISLLEYSQALNQEEIRYIISCTFTCIFKYASGVVASLAFVRFVHINI